jgi:O-antigen/teichoic acid export membrane protein
LGLAKNSIGTFISKGAIFLLRFPIGILIARFLGPEGKGLLYLLFTSASMCVAIGNLGLGPAAIYFIGKDRRRLPAVLGNLLVAAVLISVIVSIAGWLFLQYGRPDIYAQLPLWMWGAAALLVLLQFLQSLLMQVLSAVLRIKEINLLEVVSVITYLFLLVLCVIMLHMGVAGAFLAQVLSDVLATIGFLWMVLRYGGRPTWPDLTLFSASLRYGIKSYLSNLTRRLNVRLDTFLLATLAVNGVQATGIYSIATSLAELIIFIPLSIRLSLFPMVVAKSTVEANRLTSASCRHTMFLSLLCALVLASLGVFAIPYLYGERFTSATFPMLILLPGIMMLAQAHIFNSDLSGRGKPGATAISALASLIVTVILDFMLIPRYGIIGAAVASTCAYTVEFVVAGLFFIHNSGTLWREVLIIQRADLDRYFNWLMRVRALGKVHSPEAP